jgi:hypothetical protein
MASRTAGSWFSAATIMMSAHHPSASTARSTLASGLRTA